MKQHRWKMRVAIWGTAGLLLLLFYLAPNPMPPEKVLPPCDVCGDPSVVVVDDPAGIGELNLCKKHGKQHIDREGLDSHPRPVVPR